MDGEDTGVELVLTSVARALAYEVGKLSRVRKAEVKVEPEWRETPLENGLTHRHRTGRVRVVIAIEGDE